jgi:hypothetical protein
MTVKGIDPMTTDQVLLPVPPEEGDEKPVSRSKNLLLIGFIALLLIGITLVCAVLLIALLTSGGSGVPNVVIQSPDDQAQIPVGQQITLKAIASGAQDIVGLELSVDNSVVASTFNPDTNGASVLTLSKTWTFDTSGSHTISAVAYTARDKASRPETVTIYALSVQAGRTPTTAPTAGPTATATATSEPSKTAVPPPQIEYFQVSPSTINAGGCATLQWGTVTNATEARITQYPEQSSGMAPGLGGVATPGSQSVCPAETTEYTLTASGPGGTSTAKTTLTVLGGLPDLVIDSIGFAPNPAVEGQDTTVTIGIRNTGQGPTGEFKWQWQAGSASFQGRVPGLDVGRTVVVTVIWKPERADPSLATVAQVDTRDQVRESDEGNNQFSAGVQVVMVPRLAKTITIGSEAALDGYQLNVGYGSTVDQIVIGNGQFAASGGQGGELVSRGFVSFDLSAIPVGADILSVELRFYQQAVMGDPYGKLGHLLLECVSYGDSLEPAGYDAPAIGEQMLDVRTASETWYTLSGEPLTSWLRTVTALSLPPSAIGGQRRFQLRLRFAQETDGDGQEDWIAVVPGGTPLAPNDPYEPELIVTYSDGTR